LIFYTPFNLQSALNQAAKAMAQSGAFARTFRAVDMCWIGCSVNLPFRSLSPPPIGTQYVTTYDIKPIIYGLHYVGADFEMQAPIDVKRQGKEILPRVDHPHEKVSAGPIAHG
jgi:hypothetical protein